MSHSVKRFADDLSVISSSIQDHKSALLEIDEKAADLDLTLRPDKCVSILFDGTKNIDPKSNITLTNGFTHNISEAPTKILGHLIATSPAQSRSASAKKLESKLLHVSAVEKIDSRPIRGE